MKYIRIKENSAQAKAFIDFARTLSFVQFIEIKEIKGNLKILTKQEKEDFCLGKMIEEGLKTKKIPKSRILNKLKNKL